MIKTIRVESFEKMIARKLARAEKMDRGEKIEPSFSLGFETIEDLFECLTRERVRLCSVARQQPRSVTALAEALGRSRQAVTRDVKGLAELGLLRLRKQTNPGHGQVTVVEPVAERFELRVDF